MNQNNRVLSRRGAHELTKEQTEEVTGGLNTVASVILTGQIYHQDQRLDS